ncbi:putative transcription initiation factor IIF, large subunit (RAP74) [Pseudoloma neurophilia]|uniref:Putative transcription initiation factor IIF, large subunit (RAP74) n=1 Tax=Pseudoloma neurophilia TaxID=146866 RepID=A0A0R0LYZ4_9MICR|nr:putative transcription initiation factor IIF, large subunit (RAP74) [Pseudoloma neurophilia]
MKFKLQLQKGENVNRSLLILPYDISNLQLPIEIKRDKQLITENEESKLTYFNQKKKSEIKENYDEKYEQLLKEEKFPINISGSDGRSFTGKYLDNPKDNYFIFINTGKSFKIIPIKKWYKFSQKINYDTLSLEEAEILLKEKKNLNEEKKWLMHNRKQEEEIDFDEIFDDDNSDEMAIKEEETEELTKSGKELTKILDGQKKGETRSFEKKHIDESLKIKPIEEKKNLSSVIKTDLISETVSESLLISLFDSSELTIKQLINKLKQKVKINDQIKQTVQKFIKEKCGYRKEAVAGETIRKLYLK